MKITTPVIWAMTWLNKLHYSNKKKVSLLSRGKNPCMVLMHSLQQTSMDGNPNFVFHPIWLSPPPPPCNNNKYFSILFQWENWLFWSHKGQSFKETIFQRNFIVVTGGHVLLVACASVSPVCAYQMWSIILCVVVTEFFQQHANGNGQHLQ